MKADLAEHAANRRPDHETEAEGGAQQAEASSALLRRGHVGDIGAGRRKAGGSNSRDQPADEQEPEAGRQRHQNIIEAQAEIGQDDDRPPAEAIRQGAKHRLKDELHQGPGKAEIADHMRRAGGVAAHE